MTTKTAEMSSIELPELVPTSVDQIPHVHQKVYDTFHSHKTRPLSYRLTQLRKLWWALKDNEALLLEACKHDLGKAHFETYVTEVSWCLNDIIFVCDNLKKWAEDEAAADIPLVHKAMRPRIRKDPVGAVLIVGAFNFPIQLSIGPLVGAIAAGCTAVIKPSENAAHAAVAIEKVVRQALDPEAYAVVQGTIPETTALLECKWDKIFYTGSPMVGKIIAKKAAETLTPVILELGGRNPAIVTANADPRIAARRLLWAKLHNAGQVCVSQNYILVDKKILKPLLDEIKIAFQQFLPKETLTKDNPDYARVVNDRAFNRLKKMLDDSKGKILLGGAMDAETKYIEPTVVQVSDPSDPLLTDESFGPLIPILPVDNLDEAIRLANKIDPTPLGLYPFGSKAETDKIIAQTRSGGKVIPSAKGLTRRTRKTNQTNRSQHQRRLRTRLHPNPRVRRRRQLRHRQLQRQSQLRRLRPPPRHHLDPGLDREAARRALPALRG